MHALVVLHCLGCMSNVTGTSLCSDLVSLCRPSDLSWKRYDTYCGGYDND